MTLQTETHTPHARSRTQNTAPTQHAPHLPPITHTHTKHTQKHSVDLWRHFLGILVLLDPSAWDSRLQLVFAQTDAGAKTGPRRDGGGGAGRL
jgi:hypothetical protein